jgi:hypothetical protein
VWSVENRGATKEVDMTNRFRLAGWAGIAFAVLSVVGSLIAGSPPGIEDPASEIREFWIDNRDQLLVGSLLQALALPAFLVFVMALRELLVRGGEEGTFWGRVMAAGAVITVALALVGGAIGLSVTWIEGFTEDAGDDVVRAVWNAGTLPFVVGGAALFAFVGAAAVGILRTKVLPVWAGWLGAIAAVISLLGILGFLEPDLAVLGFLGFFAFAIWVVAMSIVMLRGAPADVPAPARVAAP